MHAVKAERGFLGVMMGKGYLFKGEPADLVSKHIISAAAQIPAGAAGVVVIDRTCAESVKERDVVDACFGQEELVFAGRRRFNVRREGVFRERYQTRVSAVVSYSRTWVREGGEYDLLAIHNPFAAAALPTTLFRDDVRQMRRVQMSPGRFKLRINDGE